MPKTVNEPANIPFQAEPNTLVFEDKEHNYGYVILPKLVLHAQNLSAEAKLLYAHLIGYAYEKDQCFPGYGTLCADMGKSEKTVRNFMRELEAIGLLEQKRRGLGKTNIYILLSLSKASLTLQEHHQKKEEVQNGKFSRSATGNSQVLERENFQSQ